MLAAAWADEDHPRDANGRFSSHGSGAASAASKAAHTDKTPESHKAAGEAHQAAVERHRAESERRKARAGSASSPEDRARQLRAAKRHDAKAAEHEKLAAYHRAEAGPGKQETPDVSKMAILGEGASRKVYDAGDGTVIKVAKNAAAKKDNRAEVEASGKNALLATVSDHAKDYSWVKQEKLTPVSDADLAKAFGVSSADAKKTYTVMIKGPPGWPDQPVSGKSWLFAAVHSADGMNGEKPKSAGAFIDKLKQLKSDVPQIDMRDLAYSNQWGLSKSGAAKVADYGFTKAVEEEKPKPRKSASDATLGKAEKAGAAADKVSAGAKDEAGHLKAVDAQRAAERAWCAHAFGIAKQREKAPQGSPERSALLRQEVEAVARATLHAKKKDTHYAEIGKAIDREATGADAAREDRRNAAFVRERGKAKTVHELGIHAEGPEHLQRAYDSAIQAGRFDKYFANASVRLEYIESSSDARHVPGAAAVCTFQGIVKVMNGPNVHAHGATGRGDPAALGPSTGNTMNMAHDAQEERAIIVTHELSHRMHMGPQSIQGRHEDLNAEIENAYQDRMENPGGYGAKHVAGSVKVRAGKWAASEYATTNSLEWFAETHTAYVYAPDQLRRSDPDAYVLMQTCRKALGMGE